MSETRDIKFTANGRAIAGRAEPRMHLGDFLRQEAGLTGTHLGCEHGVCGACTVLVDGEAVRSCLMLAVQANGKEVTTIEGLADGETLHPLQQAFRENHALQCGFCTSGMIMSLADFLSCNRDPTEDDIRNAISGNLCRCTGYQAIVRAGLAAAQAMREQN